MSYFKENDVVLVVHNNHLPNCSVGIRPGLKKIVKDDDGILRAEDRRASGLKDFCYCKHKWEPHETNIETNCHTTQIGGEHYKKYSIQPWDIIDEYNLNYYEGNVLKYLLREKGDRLEDLQKAKHYIDKLIEREQVSITPTPNGTASELYKMWLKTIDDFAGDCNVFPLTPDSEPLSLDGHIRKARRNKKK